MLKVEIQPDWVLRQPDGDATPLPALLALLTAVRDLGSISQAATKCGLSYRHAWGMLRDFEAHFGAELVSKVRGHGTALSPLAEKLIWADKRIRARLSPMLDSLASPGRYPALAGLMRAAAQGTVPPAPQAPPEELLQNVAAVGAATLCNDVAWPTSQARYEKDVAESRAKYPLTAGMPRNAMLCAAWPFPPREAPVRITDRGSSDILLVQNERDVNTPLAGAIRMREALGRRAVMVTVDSTGHDAYLANGNECGDRVVSHYLATGERPARDVYCR